ncbi:MAG: MarR family transcriptional regulator [Lachnospiraceae bacterium]
MMTKEQKMRQMLQEVSRGSLNLKTGAQEMQIFSQAYIQGGVQALSQNTQEELDKLLKNYRKLRRDIAGLAKSDKETIIYGCGIFIGAFKILEEIGRINRKQTERSDRQNLLGRKHVSAILVYLYQNPDARQNKIAESIQVSPSYLSEILNLLMQGDYVMRYGRNKNTRYCLTRAGRAAYKSRFAKKEEEGVYIDTDYREILQKDHFIRERTEVYHKSFLKKEDIYEKYKENRGSFTDIAVYR